MEKITINLRDLGANSSYIKIPIGQTFQSVDTSEVAETQFIEDEIEKAINPVQDYEKMRFVPFSGITEIVINLMETGLTMMTYDTFNYTNEDINFRRNRFKNSFVKLNFYDSANPTNKQLAFQMVLYNQINQDQYDIYGNLLDVSLMPITYRLVDPITIRVGISEGFYLYWYKNPMEVYPNNFYMSATYNNAADGLTTQLVAYDGLIPINLYNNINNVKYVLSSVGNMQQYSVDNNNRTIEFIGSQMIINLYKAKLI